MSLKDSLKNSFCNEENLNDEKYTKSVIKEINELLTEETNKSPEEADASKIEEYISLLEELENKSATLKVAPPDIKIFFRRYRLRKSRMLVKYAPFIAAALVLVIGVLHFSDFETPEVEKESESAMVITSQADKNKEKPSTTEKEKADITEEYYKPGNFYPSKKPGKPSVEENKKPSKGDKNNGTDLTSEADVSEWTENKESIDKDNDLTAVTLEGYTEEQTTQGETNNANGEEESTLNSENSEEVKIISIYGNFENGNIIEDFRVIGIYSDGSEKEIPKESCEITTGKITTDESQKIIVTVSYEGLSFNFTIYNDIKEEE